MDGLRALVRRFRVKLQDDMVENVFEEGYRLNNQTSLFTAKAINKLI